MAVQVYEDHVVKLPTAQMMLVDLLSIMDTLSTQRANMVLAAGNPLFRAR